MTLKCQKSWSVNSRHLSKWIIYTCAEASVGVYFEFKAFVKRFYWLGQILVKIAQVGLELLKKNRSVGGGVGSTQCTLGGLLIMAKSFTFKSCYNRQNHDGSMKPWPVLEHNR